jgi:hypothetical protein
MRNIELYEFFNMGKKESPLFKVLYSGPNGLVIECEDISPCLHIIPEIKELKKPDDGMYSSVIIFFKEGAIGAGFDLGNETIFPDERERIVGSNIIDLLKEFNINIG